MSKQEKYSNPNHHYLNRNIELLPGEVWKDIKDFEGLYEISNFGRIKSLPRYREVTITARRSISYRTKELVLKQSKRKFINTYLDETMYCLSITLYMHGSYTTFMVSRLVYAHFGPGKPSLSKDILILHNDGDSLYNHIDNLFASGYTGMHKIAYNKKRKESHFTNLNNSARQSYTEKAVEVNKKPVTQYNMKGKKIRYYESAIDASAKTGINHSSIANVIAGRYITAGGYMWRAGKGKENINISKIKKRIAEWHKSRCKRIAQYSITGKKVAEFSSMKKAAITINGSVRQISDAVHGRSKTAYKFKWKIVK